MNEIKIPQGLYEDSMYKVNAVMQEALETAVKTPVPRSPAERRKSILRDAHERFLEAEAYFEHLKPTDAERAALEEDDE